MSTFEKKKWASYGKVQSKDMCCGTYEVLDEGTQVTNAIHPDKRVSFLVLEI